MNNISYIYLIPVVAIFISAILSFFRVKQNNTKILKYFGIISTLIFLLGVLLINSQYEKKLKAEIQKLHEVLKNTNSNDSLHYDTKLNLLLIDSLNKENLELESILENINMQELVLGSQNNIKHEIKSKIVDNKKSIGDIKRYNEILNRNRDKNTKGYTTSGSSSDFTFNCPNDYTSDSLDLKLIFNNEEIIASIDFMYLSFSEKVTDNSYNELFSERYYPQKGVNGFRVKNYFKTHKDKHVNLEIGYFLKSERNKEYPYYSRIVCSNY